MALFPRALLLVAALAGLSVAGAQSLSNCNFMTIQTDLQTCLAGFTDTCLPVANEALDATVVDYCPYIGCVLDYSKCLLDLDCDIFTQATLESNYANLSSPSVKEALANCEIEVPAWLAELEAGGAAEAGGITAGSGNGVFPGQFAGATAGSPN